MPVLGCTSATVLLFVYFSCSPVLLLHFFWLHAPVDTIAICNWQSNLSWIISWINERGLFFRLVLGHGTEYLHCSQSTCLCFEHLTEGLEEESCFFLLVCWLWREVDLWELCTWAAARQSHMGFIGIGLVSILPCVSHPGCHLWKVTAHRRRNPDLLRRFHPPDSVPGLSTFEPVALSAKIMVINACSIAIKSFILNNLFWKTGF